MLGLCITLKRFQHTHTRTHIPKWLQLKCCRLIRHACKGSGCLFIRRVMISLQFEASRPRDTITCSLSFSLLTFVLATNSNDKLLTRFDKGLWVAMIALSTSIAAIVNSLVKSITPSACCHAMRSVAVVGGGGWRNSNYTIQCSNDCIATNDSAFVNWRFVLSGFR